VTIIRIKNRRNQDVAGFSVGEDVINQKYAELFSLLFKRRVLMSS